MDLSFFKNLKNLLTKARSDIIEEEYGKLKQIRVI